MNGVRASVATCLALTLLAALPGAAAGQHPEPRDPPPVQVPIPDEAVATDTIPDVPEEEPAVADTLGAAPVFPRFPPLGAAGFDRQVWEWDRHALRAYHGFSLLELLERIPGLTVTRTGGVGAPAGLSSLGSGGGRIRILVDGMELDPLARPTHEIRELPLVDVDHLRVTRAPDGITIEVDRWRPASDIPFSEVEAGTGDFRSRILRAFFTRPVTGRNQLSAGFDLVDTEGFQRQAPFTRTAALLRLDHVFSDRWAAQAEYQQRGEDRVAPFPEVTARREVALRFRGSPTDRISIDGQIARLSWWDREEIEDSDTLELPPRAALSVTQLVGRAAWQAGPAWLEAWARWRPGDDLWFAPRADAGIRGGLGSRLGAVDGAVDWMERDGARGVRLEGGARLDIIPGVGLFARGGSGGLPVPLFGPAGTDATEGGAEASPWELRRQRMESVAAGGAWTRAGAVLHLFGGRLEAAAWTSELDTVAAFGLPFDELVAAESGDGVWGYEVSGRLPLFTRRAALEGHWTEVGEAALRPYLPARQLRLALHMHGVFREGNLEPDFWLETLWRGHARVPAGVGDDPGAPATVTDPYWTVRASLQIRVIDVRAFVTVENILFMDDRIDVPGFRRAPLLQATFGARWQFFN